ncbi:H/ACA ribonucleoprotein complex non-core subunit NAF1-like protein, partial [Tanacetum coccineum]
SILQAGNPVKEILLKLNLPYHRILKDEGSTPGPSSDSYHTTSSSDTSSWSCIISAQVIEEGVDNHNPFNSESEVPVGIEQGSLISFILEFTDYVLNNNNLYKKGYDASGENDEELSEELEFSDDEKEAEYKKMIKMSKEGSSEQKNKNMKKDKKSRI